MGGLGLEREQERVPESGLLPTPEPAVDRLPGPVLVGAVPPRGTGPQNPDHSIVDGAVILGGSAGRWALRGQQRCQLLPLMIGLFMSSW